MRHFRASFKEEDANPTRGIEHDHLSSALDSFYASLGGAESGGPTPTDTPPQSTSPAPPTVAAAATAMAPSMTGGAPLPVSEDSRGSNSPGPGLQEEERERKKKKVRSTLTMKRVCPSIRAKLSEHARALVQNACYVFDVGTGSLLLP